MNRFLTCLPRSNFGPVTRATFLIDASADEFFAKDYEMLNIPFAEVLGLFSWRVTTFRLDFYYLCVAHCRNGSK